MGNAKGRFVVGEWQHIFVQSIGARTIRFMFDRVDNRLLAAQVEGAEEGEWFRASGAQFDDIEDSLKNGNEDAIDKPVEYGLEVLGAQDVPEWARPALVSVPGLIIPLMRGKALEAVA